MIVFVPENHDKWPNVSPVQHFCSGFKHANLVSFFLWFNLLPKIRFSNVYFYKYEHLHVNVLFKKMIMFSPISGRWDSAHLFRTGGGRCPR